MAEPLNIKVVSDAEAEQCEFAVCCRQGMFSPFVDNVEAECAHCQHPIFHRPHLPKAPTKICMECAALMMGATKQ